MQHTEQIDKLMPAFIAAQMAMKDAEFDAVNGGFGSKYSTIAAVLPEIRAALNAHGLAVSQHPGFDGVLVTLTTYIIHESGQMLWSTDARPLGGKKNNHAVQSCITYMRRCTLQAILGNVSGVEDDDGNEAADRPPREDFQQRVTRASGLTWAVIIKGCKAKDWGHPGDFNKAGEAKFLREKAWENFPTTTTTTPGVNPGWNEVMK